MGVKISALPSIVAPALTDIFPVVQNGVTYKETVTQLSTLIGTVATTTITGTPNQVIASAPVGAVTLSLPQSIAITSDVIFGSVTFNPTTKGIVGTTTNNNAGSGFVGELISSVISFASAVSVPASETPANLTSISLTVGDWDVWGNITFLPDVTTSMSALISWVSSTSATLPDASLWNSDVFPAFVPGLNSTLSKTAPMQRFSLSSPTIIYLSGYTKFTISTMKFCGGIYARRRR